MDVTTIDPNALERQTVNVLPLLLQIGMLTCVPGEPLAVTPPNEYARRSLQKMLENALWASSSIFPDGRSPCRSRI